MSQPTSSTTFFENASNLYIAGNVTNAVYNQASQRTGIDHLRKAIVRSADAMHDSQARYPPPRCHPHTREDAVKTIVAFVQDPKPKKPVVWLNAPFGHGKSAVMQTSIEQLRELGLTDGFGGAFFFGRGKEGRDKSHYVLPTILYQIAHNIPGMHSRINDAVNADPLVLSKSMEDQVTRLLVIAFQDYTSEGPNPTIFIDGLDECDSPGAQRSVLEMVKDVILVHKLPLRFVVASRPEAHIIDVFRAQSLSSITELFPLDNDFRNMKRYFRDHFDRIYEARQDVMSEVTQPWPSDDVISTLAWRASGQYLFAATVIRFVEDEYDNPLSQLEAILTHHPRHAAAFTSMDELYIQILSACPERLRPSLLWTLGVIAMLENMHWRLQATPVIVIEDLVDIPVTDIWTILRSVRAIIRVKNLVPTTPSNCSKLVGKYLSAELSTYHVSLKEFLLNSSRAGPFYIDLPSIRATLMKRMDFLLSAGLTPSYLAYRFHPATWRLAVKIYFDELSMGLENLAEHWPHSTKRFNALRDCSPSFCEAASLDSQCVGVLYQVMLAYYPGQDIEPSTQFISDYCKVRQMACDSVLPMAFRKRFESSSAQQIPFTTILQHLVHLTNDVHHLQVPIESISRRLGISHLETLVLVEGYYPFLDFITHDTIKLSIEPILRSPEAIGLDAYLACRSATILGMLSLYNDFLGLEDNRKHLLKFSDMIARAKQTEGSTKNILRLEPTDDDSTSAMSTLAARMISPESQRILLKPEVACAHQYLVLCTFLQLCNEARNMGAAMENVYKPLRDFVYFLAENNILNGAFGVGIAEIYYVEAFDLYESLFCQSGNEIPADWHLLDAIGDDDHAAIADFCLRCILLAGLRYSRLSQESLTIHWSFHLSRAGFLSNLLEDLLALSRRSQENNSSSHPQPFPRLRSFSWLSFADGVAIWKQKHLDPRSGDALALDELCSNIRATTMSPGPGDASVLKEEEGRDAVMPGAVADDGDSVYEDALEEQHD